MPHALAATSVARHTLAGNAAVIGYGRSKIFKLHIFWKCKMQETAVMKQGSK